MDGLRALADSHGLFLIEDCAQAHGAQLHGRPVGSMGDVAAFSFCTDKIMTTGGEGGMLLCQNEAVWRRAWSYKDHGKAWDAVYNREHPPGFRWLHESFGTNWRLTEMQSAIGRVQLRKLPDWAARRRRNAGILIERLGALPALRLPVPPEGVAHAYYKLYAYVRPEGRKGVRSCIATWRRARCNFGAGRTHAGGYRPWPRVGLPGVSFARITCNDCSPGVSSVTSVKGTGAHNPGDKQ